MTRAATDRAGPSLLATIAMAWNTEQLQALLDRWANRRFARLPQKLA